MSDDEGTGDNIYEQAEKLKAEHKERNKAKLTAIDGGRAGEPKATKPAAKPAAKKRKATEDALARELETNEELSGLLCLDTFSASLRRMRTIPGFENGRVEQQQWGDTDSIDLLRWFQRNGFPDAKISTVERALLSHAVSRQRSMAADHLKGLPKWDHVERLATFFQDVCGTLSISIEQTAYLREVATRFFIQIVNRVFNPGCQADIVLILEGTQGILKSSLCRAMALKDEWFSDTMPRKLDKESADHLKGKLLIELAELAALPDARSLEVFKAFMTVREDKHRSVFFKHERSFRRQNVFIATTNENGGYLLDRTGNRRYLPVKCGQRIDTALAVRIMPQLYAEAIHLLRSGENAYFDPDILDQIKIEQQLREKDDPWRDAILQELGLRIEGATARGETEFYARTLDFLNAVKMLENIDGERQRAGEMKIGEILRNLGGARRKIRRGGSIPSWWYLFDIAEFDRKFRDENV